MSYCTLEEAFQTSISDSVLPPSRQQFEEPGKGEKGRLKPRRHKRSPLPPQEPSVVEPDRAAHNYKQAPELLGAQPRNDTSTSISSYLIGVNDPGEDYFPYPHGASDENGFDKSFMLEPNWSDQFIDRIPGQQTETPPLPGAAVDGYSTLYRKVPLITTIIQQLSKPQFQDPLLKKQRKIMSLCRKKPIQRPKKLRLFDTNGS